MAKRTYPNDYFAWYNDDQRLAILCQDVSSTSSAERTTEKYDTFQDSGNLSGTITDADCSDTTITFTSASHGLATGDRVSISGTTNFNDDNLANQTVTISSADVFTMTRSTSSSATDETGTFTSLFIDNGLRITYKSKYEPARYVTEDLDTDIGLDTSLHPMLVCYLKSRLYEDAGNFEQANYYRSMYENQMMKQKSRKSGVRGLSVPNL
tara:strand:+ start:2820 stop:3449 length:630 start_codon:yes stop_codon:yes gene_type:complete